VAAAPLLSIPEAPAPPGKAETVAGHGGVPLRAALFDAEQPRGSVVLSPGRTEPIEKYYEVIGELTGRGFSVLAHDWRGQGRSHRLLEDRLAGHAGSWRDFIEDLRAILSVYDARLPRPWLAVGHSMGGCLTLLALQEGLGPFAGAVLSAPMLRIRGLEPEWFVTLAAGLMTAAGLGSRPLPGKLYDPLEDAFDGDRLTHDPARYRRHKAQLRADPDLALGHPTWGWLDFALEAGRLARSPSRLERVQAPVAIVAAGQDRLVDSAASRRAAGALPRGRYVLAEAAFHEVLMETDERRAVFWRAFDELSAPLLAGGQGRDQRPGGCEAPESGGGGSGRVAIGV
jgi:lysophospholipase